MKRPIALLVGAVVAAGMAVGPAPTVLADSTAVTGDNWTMSLGIPNTSWSQLITTNFLACADLPIQLAVAAGPGVVWSVTGQITGAGSTTVLETFSASDSGPAGTLSIPGVAMCEHFNSSLMPPDHEYVATGTATVEGSTTPALPFEARFTIGPMQSSVQWRSHELRDGVSAILGQVFAHTNDGFQRPAPVGTITLERLEGSTWLRAGEAASSPDGSFVVLAGMVLPTDSYFRLLYPGDYWVAANVGMPVKVWPPFVPAVIPAPMPPAPTPVVAVQPTARVKIKAVSARSRLRVDVNPNMGSKYWTFQIQRRNADGSWKALKTYRTWGSTEKRTLNLRKGTYRVWVNPKFGHQGVMSANDVTLKR